MQGALFGVIPHKELSQCTNATTDKDSLKTNFPPFQSSWQRAWYEIKTFIPTGFGYFAKRGSGLSDIPMVSAYEGVRFVNSVINDTKQNMLNLNRNWLPMHHLSKILPYSAPKGIEFFNICRFSPKITWNYVMLLLLCVQHHTWAGYHKRNLGSSQDVDAQKEQV